MWTVNLPARSGALWQISPEGRPGNLNLGSAATLGSSSRSWLSDLHGVVQIHMSLFQSINCDSFRSSSNVKSECLGTRLNYPEWAFVRPLKWGSVGISSDKNELSLLEVMWQ